MKIVVTVVGFVLIFLTGYWLYRVGQPFNAGMLTLHKLISVAAIVYLVVIVLNINKMAPLSKGELIACIITGLLLLGAVVTGGVLSAAKNLPAVVQTLHKVLSILTVLSTVAMFLFSRRR
ncbi:MAG: hypothetical protein NTZ12_05640 [Candidatus Aminicenantes bacterium]|nr:hypothetical protein [Candidatus Aminicenantes bacterium]